MPIRIKKIINKIFEPKKIVSFLVLFSVIFQLALPLIVLGQDENLPLPKESLTNPEIKQMEKLAQTGGGCSWTNWISNLGECLIGRGMAFVGFWMLKLSAVALYMASGIFDVSADISLDYRAYSSKTATAVYAGWRASRDFANLFFIFIILIIALALILQMNQYYSKQVLVQLVMMAVFINFSFFMCQQIINLSNSAAIYFKNKAVPPGKTLSSVFVEKLDPQKLLGGYKPQIGQGDNLVPQEMQGKVNETLSAPDISLVGIIISSFGGMAIILTAAFILLAAAVMFLIRMAILWNLIILAPIAFVASILPDTKSHYNAWWSRFTKEVFFAPSMLFMFYIEMLILESDFLKNYVSRNSVTGLGNSAVFNYYLMAMYIVMLLLLAKSLMFARSMGASGANHAIKYGNKMRDWVGGKAGKIGKAPFYAAGREARRLAAPKMERILTGESKFGTVPVVKSLSRAIAKPILLSEKARVSNLEKRWEQLSGKEIAKEGAPPRTREALMAWVSQMQKKNSLGMVSPQRLQQVHGWMSQLGMDTRDVETYMPSLTKDDKAKREKAVQRQGTDKVFDIAKNNEEFIKNIDLTTKYWGDQHLRELIKTADVEPNAKESARALIKNYVDKFGNNMDNIIQGLESQNNYSAAKFLKTKEGEEFIRNSDYGNNTVKKGTAIIKMQAKESLDLKDKELIDKIRTVKSVSPDEEKQETAEIIKSSDDKRLSSILDELLQTERQELKAVLDTEDPKISEKIVKIMLDLASSPAEQIKVLNQMSKTDIDNIDYDGLANRAGIGINSILDNMIKTFSNRQIQAIVDRGDDMTKNFARRLKESAVSATGKDDVEGVAKYLEGLNKQISANYIRSAPGVKDILGISSPPPSSPPKP